ncbi:DNA internalization-related competence protein ComEC/Rec2 [bacterium]|nr:DNA internalization-related competence protein ComEC/Rec2 [bacterium]
MDILQNKLNITILFSILFILGIVSFFANIPIILLIFVSLGLVGLIYTDRIKPIAAFLLFLTFLGGFYIADFRVKNSDALYYIAPKNNIVAEGKVVSILETNKPDKTRFYFKVDKINTGYKEVDNLKSKTIVTLFEPREVYSKIQIGDTLRLKGNLRLPQKAANPNEFGYKNYLQNMNTFSTMFIQKDNFEIVKKPQSIGWKFLQKVNIQRNAITEKHSKILKSPYLELLGGVVFGDDAITPTDELKESFRISGLLHLLAASGLNVGIIFGIWFFIGNLFKMNYRLNIIIGSFLIILYTCMTGFSPSILRATLMIEFVLFGKLLDRKADSLALISFVCFLMLLYNPSWICHIGFQLSFLVTTGLILAMPVISEWCKKYNKFWQFLINSAAVPVIAQIWVLPVQMFYFNTFTMYSPLANILVLPFITIVSFTGFISSIIAMFPFTPDILIKICDMFLSPFLIITVKISDFISSLPNANLVTIQPNIVQILLYYGFVLLITKFFIDEMKNKKLIYIAISVFAILLMSFIKIPDNKLHLTFFSVKNADSCLVKTPENHYFVIDTGKKSFSGSYSSGEGVIAKYLLAKGITKIDYVILSHLDNDHIGGTVGLLEKIKVKKVFVNTDIPTTQTSQELFDYLKKHNIPYEIVKNDTVLYEEKDLKVRAYLNKSIDENENSIINLLEYKNFNALFMGDAGIGGYEILPVRKIDVLKLGHHGAKDTINKAVLDKIKPQTVIVSTGQNQYGHPHFSIIDLFSENNIHYLRTDNKNTIDISTDGTNKQENCYLPEKRKFLPCDNHAVK